MIEDITNNILSFAKDSRAGLLELAWPTRCVICDMPGKLICDQCYDTLPLIAQSNSCKKCGTPYGKIECTECWNRDGEITHNFAHATCAMEYTKESSHMIKCFKDQGELRLANMLANLIASALKYDGCLPNAKFTSRRKKIISSPSNHSELPDFLTYIPATPTAVARRGYDHMQLIADSLSNLIGIDCIKTLKAYDKLDQRELNKTERSQNMSEAFGLDIDSDVLKNKRILLIDDVFTTGSTLDCASKILCDAGTSEVSVATICRVW